MSRSNYYEATTIKKALEPRERVSHKRQAQERNGFGGNGGGLGVTEVFIHSMSPGDIKDDNPEAF